MSLGALIGCVAAGSLLGGLFGASAASKQAKAELQAGRGRGPLPRGVRQGQIGNLAAFYGTSRRRWPRRICPGRIRGPVRCAVQGRQLRKPSSGGWRKSTHSFKLPNATTSKNPITRAVSASAGGKTLTAQQRAALQAERDALVAKSGGSPGKAGSMDLEAIKGMGPGLIAQYEAMGKQQKGVNAQMLNQYDAGTNRLGSLARSIETAAAQYGRAAKKTIRQDAQESLNNANGLATASLMSRAWAPVRR